MPADGTRFRMDFMPVAGAEGRPEPAPPRSDEHVPGRPAQIRWPDSSSSARATSTSGSDPMRAMSWLADPEGNEFCVIEPETRSSRTAGRLARSRDDRGRSGTSGALRRLGRWSGDQDEETAIRVRRHRAVDHLGWSATAPEARQEPAAPRCRRSTKPNSTPRSPSRGARRYPGRHRPGRRRLGRHGRSRQQRVLRLTARVVGDVRPRRPAGARHGTRRGRARCVADRTPCAAHDEGPRRRSLRSEQGPHR